MKEISPTITVLMPVYNCENYIYEAVQSILNQTFSDFELIIIDDCSNDKTVSIIKSIVDSRIKLVEKTNNRGIVDSLNHGVTLSKGKYIARMDGDDISLPGRFKRQLDFLEKNPEFILCGSALQVMDSALISRYATDHDSIKAQLCFSSCFHHPTIMVKREVLLENKYNSNFEPAEDYELWTRLVFLGKTKNLEEVLYKYRRHHEQTSSVRKYEQEEKKLKCKLIMLDKLSVTKVFTEEQIDNAFNLSKVINDEEVKQSFEIYNTVLNYNAKLDVFNQSVLIQSLKHKRIFLIRNFFNDKRYSYYSKVLFAIRYSTFKELIDVFAPIKKIKKKCQDIWEKSIFCRPT